MFAFMKFVWHAHCITLFDFCKGFFEKKCVFCCAVRVFYLLSHKKVIM